MACIIPLLQLHIFQKKMDCNSMLVKEEIEVETKYIDTSTPCNLDDPLSRYMALIINTWFLFLNNSPLLCLNPAGIIYIFPVICLKQKSWLAVAFKYTRILCLAFPSSMTMF